MNALFRIGCAVVAGGLAWCAALAPAQTIAPAYAGFYSLADLGPVPGVPANFGGLTFRYASPNQMLIGGEADRNTGAYYVVTAVRGADSHVVGFSGAATRLADAAYVDGGAAYGPNGTLLFARAPVNQLGETLLGSTITDRVIDLVPFGVESTSSALTFVPAGYRAAGRLKLTTYGGGQWNDVTLAPGGVGLDVTHVTHVDAARLGGAPEGLVYIPLNSPLFASETLLVSEYGTGKIAAYDVDANGDPVVATRRDFITGLASAESAAVDPLTGDCFFTTYGSGHIIVVHGFANSCAGQLRGDSNGDNVVNNFDIDSFTLALTSRSAYEALYGAAAYRCRNDMNHDAVVNNFDIDPFVACLVQNLPPGHSCP